MNATTHARSPAYERLTPVLQSFVDQVLAGEKPTTVARRLRPHLKNPEVRASKWRARPDVKAAIAEFRSPELRLVVAAEAIQRHLASIETLLSEAPVQERLDQSVKSRLAGISSALRGWLDSYRGGA